VFEWVRVRTSIGIKRLYFKKDSKVCDLKKRLKSMPDVAKFSKLSQVGAVGNLDHNQKLVNKSAYTAN
jgi:hypothetical protein